MNRRNQNNRIIGCLRDQATALIASGTPPLQRETSAFAYILEHVPIHYNSGDLLAGDFGWREEDAESLRRLFPEKEPSPCADPDITPEAQLHADFHCFGGYSPAHTCIDYAKLLNFGIEGMLTEIEEAGATSYRDAMSLTLRALQNLADRYAVLLEQAGESVLAEICRRVPRRPAENFREALQSIWFAHLAIGISEYSDASISLGRLDQYAYPFFQQSLKNGCLESDLDKSFAAMVDKLNRYGDAACALNLGGVDSNGNDLCNDLTRMIVRVCKNKLLPSPILAARIHPEFPQDLFDELIDPALFAIGQPTFYGEFPCRDTLRERGVPESDLVKWAANSCMGLVVEGCEVSNMWGAVINFLLPLELTLNQGRPFHKDLPISFATEPLGQGGGFADLQRKFLDYLGELIDFCIKASRFCTDQVRVERPNPYLSAFLNNCTERGKDRLDGGADYYIAIVEAFGLVNAADALYTIKQLVFEQQRYTLDELTTAVKNNFQGHKKLLCDIRSLPKYGNGHPEVDRLVAELAACFAGKVRAHSTADTCFAPSFHTLTVHVVAGSKMGASLDGRLSGAPLAKNIGTSPGMAAAGLTGLIRSAATIDQKPFFGGQALDVSIDTKLLKTTSDKRKMQALIQTYFGLGGLQMQVNGLNPDVLVEAIANPDDHEDLIVRIGGYSDYFNNLGLDVRKEMASRFAEGL